MNKNKVLGIIGTLGFFGLLGSVGALEQDNIGMGQFFIQSAISVAMLAFAGIKAGVFED